MANNGVQDSAQALLNNSLPITYLEASDARRYLLRLVNQIAEGVPITANPSASQMEATINDLRALPAPTTETLLFAVITQLLGGAPTSATDFTGIGSPVGFVYANKGSQYTDGNTGSIWVNTGSNGSNTGWTQKVA